MRSNLNIDRGPNNSATITWTDGYGPFQLQKTFDFSGWENVGNPTIARSREISTSEHPHAFFRLQEQIALLDIDLEYELGTKLIWLVPDLE